MSKIADTVMQSGFSFQEELLLQALERQALTGRLMVNPHVTGFSSFAKQCLILSMIKKHQRLVRTYINIF